MSYTPKCPPDYINEIVSISFSLPHINKFGSILFRLSIQFYISRHKYP